MAVFHLILVTTLLFWDWVTVLAFTVSLQSAYSFKINPFMKFSRNYSTLAITEHR